MKAHGAGSKTIQKNELSRSVRTGREVLLLLYQPEHTDGGGDSGEEAYRQGFGEVFFLERGTREAAFFFLFFHGILFPYFG